MAERDRLMPTIFTSELFYDGKLKARHGPEGMRINGYDLLSQPGLYYLPVPHTGNQNSSPEEARAIKTLVDRVLASGPTWVDGHGSEHALTLDDIIIVAPYNAQVFKIQQLLPAARVGTVDKFQG